MKRIKIKNFTLIIIIIFFPLCLLAQIENWVYKYDGPANSADEAYEIVYGNDDNLYITGHSVGTGTSNDFIVISLNISGDTNWVYRLNGPGNSIDIANTITYGEDNNIYAAGYINKSSSDDDLTVVSLTTSGDTNWVYRYNSPANSYDRAYSIVYGGDSNLYIAGHTADIYYNFDILVMSLKTSGDTNWVYSYDGPANEYDGASSVVYGADGNIYVGGYSSYPISDEDFTVISLKTSGDTNWIYRYNGTDNSYDRVNSIVYGEDNNIYTCGYSTNSTTYYDFTVISLTTSGDTNWVYILNGTENSVDIANSIVYGEDGNIYTAGYIDDSLTSRDFTVVSLSTSGDTNWIYRYNGSGNGSDRAESIVYGADGNIYAAGSSTDTTNNTLFTVIKLDTSGDANWIYQYESSKKALPEFGDGANDIVYGADGNLYVAGGIVEAGTDYYDFAVISLGGTGGINDDEDNPSLSGDDIINIFPNPLTKFAKIKFNISESNLKSSLYLYDITGRLKETIWENNKIPESYYYRPHENLTSGIYYLLLEIEDKKYTEKLIIVI
jgi:hypothetical protein